ncbi:MAG: thioredoxin-disulfide reductase [Candidatus Wallbacteria bacterium]|nr:thioredoxin-disulfide reductase [Candidatus Wallbacteria bacterium]
MELLDLIIIGGGPAGLTAGLYASRSRLSTLIIEKTAPGGMILLSSEIENYPGTGKTGTYALMQIMENQCREFGCSIKIAEALEIRKTGHFFTVRTSEGEFSASSLILATGTRYKKLEVPGEREFTGRGVSYCATCDGPFFRNQDVAVVGGGNSACEEALHLTKFAKKVYLIHRRLEFRATSIVKERLKQNSKIVPVLNSVVQEIRGKTGVENILLRNTESGAISELPVTGTFIFVGLIPNSEIFKNLVELEEGFVKTRELQTDVPGIFAAGDLRVTPLRQVITACADGASAAFLAEKYLSNLRTS